MTVCTLALLSPKALGAFIGGFPTACIYTALLAYLEGRRNTELYISALNMVVVFGRFDAVAMRVSVCVCVWV